MGMSLRRFGIIVISLAMAFCLAPIGRAVATTTAAGSNSLTIVGAPGSAILDQGQVATDDAPGSGQIQSTDNSITWDVNTAAPNGPSFLLQGPTDEQLMPGTYSVTSGSSGPGLASWVIADDGDACSGGGKITILQISRDPASNVITSFAAIFEATCLYAKVPNVGEIRWNAGTTSRFGVIPAGTPATQTISVPSPADHAVTYGAATVTAPSGAASTAFTITSDSCSGQTVAAGASCSVGVRGWAEDVGGEAAALNLPATSATADSQLVTLTLAGKETPTGGYVPVSPARILDTRTGNGAPKAAVGAGKSITVQITGRGGVASTGVRAVVLNLTVNRPTASGYLTAYPAGASRPKASSINFIAGETRANLVTVPLPASGKLTIYNASGSTQIIGDVNGYYLSNASTATKYGSYQPSPPYRLYDSRTTYGGSGPLPAGYYTTLWADYGSDLGSHVKALALNITAVRPTGWGYLTAYPESLGQNVPYTSSLNFAKGATTANMVIVPVTYVYDSDAGASVSEFNLAAAGASTNFIVDVVGFYDDHWSYHGGRFASLASPKRIVDTRISLGTTPLGSGSTHVITPPTSVAGWNSWALVCNATLVHPTAATYLKLWGVGMDKPATSNVNAAADRIIANMAMPIAGTNNAFNAYNATGTTNLVIDAAGTIEGYPQLPDGVVNPDSAPARLASGAATARPLATGAVAGVVGSTG